MFVSAVPLLSCPQTDFSRSINLGWNDRVQPWLHYVPVKVDYSDLYDIVAFFRGDDEQGITGEDALAKMIAANGRNWSSKHWRKEDMVRSLAS